jgi:hypothetical protein
VVVGDFNGDGRPDLAVARQFADVEILLADPSGGFLPPVAYNAGPNPSWMAVNDLDRDGKLDLTVVNGYDATGTSGSSVSILEGNGDGTFQPPVSYAVADGAYSVAVADLDGDGSPDLAVACGLGGVSVLLANHPGKFQQLATQAAGTAPASIAVGDFNGDGKPDLVVANSGSDNVSILLGMGRGEFQPQATYPTGAKPVSVVVGDFNSDGRQDLAVLNNYGLSVSILFGNGDGTFQPSLDTTVGTPGGYGPYWMAEADFNGDGKMDLAVGMLFSNEIAILLGNGDGTFRQLDTYQVLGDINFVATGDFNGDGKPDLAVPILVCDYPTPCYGGIVILLGNGDGTFDMAPGPSFGAVGPLAVGDFNGDGTPDIASDCFCSNFVAVSMGNGDGAFGGDALNVTGWNSGSMAAGDLDANGTLDLAVLTGANTVAILLGVGDGSFQPQKEFVVGECPSAVAFGDFNGDGKPGLAVADNCANNVAVLTNTTP